MLPEERLSSESVSRQLVNPWTGRDDISQHWGPVALQDVSEGLHVRLWQARIDGNGVFIGAPGVDEIVWYSHGSQLREVSLTFNQNGAPAVAFVDASGDAFLRWFDPVFGSTVNLALASTTVNPRVTLDDYRPFNIGNSDIVLSYIRAGQLHYRLQRDRFENEYTPPIGDGGSPASASQLRHLSMNAALRVEFLTDGSDGQNWTLSQIVEDICRRAGLPSERLDLGKLDWKQIVRGYTIGNAYSAAGSLQALAGCFFFDPANRNGQVAFVTRGEDSVATVLQDDMIDNGEDVEDSDSRRQDSIAIPRVLHLNYYDVAGGLNTDKQRSERPEGTRSEGEQSMQTPVVMSADEAATVVSIMHGLSVEQQKGELNFALPDNWLRLIESDPVFVQTDTKMVRAIIAKVETETGEQRYRAIRDRQSLYTTNVQGIPAAPVTQPPSSVAGPTLIEFLDIPTLRDTHDQLGFYMAVSGILPAWPGASVELSMDGGATYQESQTTRISSIMGELVSELGDHPYPFPDEVNTCQVEVGTPNATLENTTLTGMMNRRNLSLIGNEIVNFADADEVTEGTWELSHWLRGRKHTTTESHAIGERFVLLDTAMFIPAELAWLGKTLTFRAATLGRPVDEATILSVTFSGQSQTEYAPAYLQARRDGTDAVLSWQGVGRLGGGVNVAMGAYFVDYHVTLTDGSVTQTFDQTAESLTTSLSAFTGPVTVRVQQRNQLTGLGPYIEVTI